MLEQRNSNIAIFKCALSWLEAPVRPKVKATEMDIGIMLEIRRATDMPTEFRDVV